MVDRNTLCTWLDALFAEVGKVEDGSNNGLQVEGTSDVRRIAFGVDACQALFEKANDWGADLVFVHHGLSWGSGFRRICGLEARRFGTLLRNDISLYASHLPLDAHPEIGHNALIARMLELQDCEPACEYGGLCIGQIGTLPGPLLLDELADKVGTLLETECQTIDTGGAPISRVVVVSGHGSGSLADCASLGVDCLVTGEIEHQDYHPAHELGISIVAAGHYRSEIPGVKAVMERIRADHGVECLFFDIPTGM
ncbi:MAG: Nif3-like dinuclear metal center hexameric protein [Lentisphaeria bacterium]|nr:Nif3-like dinuclear metal center hexameric protein [Lentisphaeria bacterium]